MYEPQEDSFLLQEAVRKYIYGHVLDMGTGSGILALEAAKKARKVLAVDIDKAALKCLNKKITKERIKNIEVVNSNLFSNIDDKDKFDTITFNPPYLPQDRGIKENALYGGKKGYETIERFFSRVNNYLKKSGVILIVFSSITNKIKVNEIIGNYGFEFEEIGTKRIFFEELFVYIVKKSGLLIELNDKKIRNIKKFSMGKRGIIYVGDLKDRKVAIKVERKDSKARRRIENEVFWLKILNKKCVGPKLIYCRNNFFVYEFIDGQFILDNFLKNNELIIKRIIKNIFEQLFILDSLKINKEEMHHPVKHIIIDKNNKPVLVDFERCYKTRKPKNVTQFCQFIVSNRFLELLKNKNIIINKEEIIKYAKIYKKNINKNNLKRILKLLT